VATNSYRVENHLYDADDLGARDGDGSAEVHRKLIEPWRSALFQSEHLNLLVGSGFGLRRHFAARDYVLDRRLSWRSSPRGD
jgi:hypothetical protein